jgi:hypothetical protein
MAAAPLFTPVLGPAGAFRLPADGGASMPSLVLFMGVTASLEVSAGVGSAIWAGVSGDDDDDDGFDASDGFDEGS